MKSVDNTFSMLHDDLSGLGEDVRGLRTEMVGMRADLARVQDRMIQIGFGLVAALMTALIAVVLSLV